MSSKSETDKLLHNNNVGPIVRAGEVAEAVAEAAIIDNPDKEVTVEANGAYSRIYAESELIVTRETLQEELGRDFKMNELEINLASFAGRIEVTEDQARFYYNTTL
ncbi:MAG: monooxygenase [Halieaceae bacterium]|jgi:toluene monooxygenase system protein D|nr:monooxygenase [Halieaceae bacterium]MBT5702673.1 monooxygenase [Gammaproteobacteria bacterium]MBT7717789.1 monooxygenase [Halieaceae bacterium]